MFQESCSGPYTFLWTCFPPVGTTRLLSQKCSLTYKDEAVLISSVLNKSRYMVYLFQHLWAGPLNYHGSEDGLAALGWEWHQTAVEALNKRGDVARRDMVNGDGWQLDSVLLEVFSNLNNPMVLWLIVSSMENFSQQPLWKSLRTDTLQEFCFQCYKLALILFYFI